MTGFRVTCETDTLPDRLDSRRDLFRQWSSTILTFTDFFWIWFIVAIASGGTTYLQKSESNQKELDAVKQQLAALTEEIRALRRNASQ